MQNHLYIIAILALDLEVFDELQRKKKQDIQDCIGLMN